jgi:hypothetical protein
MGRGKGMIKERVNSPASLDGGGDRSTLHDVSTYWLQTEPSPEYDPIVFAN